MSDRFEELLRPGNPSGTDRSQCGTCTLVKDPISGEWRNATVEEMMDGEMTQVYCPEHKPAWSPAS